MCHLLLRIILEYHWIADTKCQFKFAFIEMLETAVGVFACDVVCSFFFSK